MDGAEELYKEIRVENTLQDGQGNEVALKEGAEVEVTIEAEPEATKPKRNAQSKGQSTPKDKKAPR